MSLDDIMRRDLADAEREGKQILSDAAQQAGEKSKELLRQAEARAEARIADLDRETRDQCGEIRRLAAEKLEAAAGQIVKKVVEV